MWGTVAFEADNEEVKAVQAVSIEGGEPQTMKLDASSRMDEPGLKDGAGVVEVGLVYTGHIYGENDEIGVKAVYYDTAADAWWTEDTGTIGVDLI